MLQDLMGLLIVSSILVGAFFATRTMLQDAIKRGDFKSTRKSPQTINHNSYPPPEQYIETTLNFSKFEVKESWGELATERQITHLKNRYNMDIPTDMPKWTASNLITCLHYIEAVHQRINGKRYRKLDNSTILKTLSWILSDDDMSKHIKRLNQTRFRSGNDFEVGNLPTSSKYYKMLENYMSAL